MTPNNLLKALKVLVPLLSNKDAHDVCAEHDELYLRGPPPKFMFAEDVQKLEDAGFKWDEGTEAWKCYT